MKGAQELIIAGLLGVLAVVLNWLYLQDKTRDVETISFIGVKNGVRIEPGTLITEKHLQPVAVPSQSVTNLKDYAYQWQDLKTVVGIRATRAFYGGELIFRQDYRTPPPDLELEDNQRLIWVTVDSGSFVPALVNPGDQVTFILPTPAPPVDGAPAAGTGNSVLASPEMIGPFTVGSLGNRLGSSEVMRANRIAQVQERQLGIIVNVDRNRFEDKATRLMERLRTINYRDIRIAPHPRDEE